MCDLVHHVQEVSDMVSVQRCKDAGGKEWEAIVVFTPTSITFGHRSPGSTDHILYGSPGSRRTVKDLPSMRARTSAKLVRHVSLNWLGLSVATTSTATTTSSLTFPCASRSIMLSDCVLHLLISQCSMLVCVVVLLDSQTQSSQVNLG